MATFWFPYIDGKIETTDEKCRFESLSLIVSALHALANSDKNELSEVIEVCKLVSILDVPSWMIPELVDILPNKNKLGPLFELATSSLSEPIVKSTITTLGNIPIHEQQFLGELNCAISEEDITRLDSLKRRMVHPPDLQDWVLHLLVLSYCIAPEYMVRLLTPSSSPFMVQVILDLPMFKWDLKLHSLISEHGSVWDRIEVIESLLELLRSQRKRLSYRLMLLSCIREALENSFQSHQQRILVLYLNKLPSIHNVGLTMIQWLGQCLGAALANQISSGQIETAFLEWNPYLSSNNVEYLLIAVRNEITDDQLLSSWDKAVSSIWLNLILKTYAATEKKLFNSRITYLENVMIRIMSNRFSSSVYRLIGLIQIIMKKLDNIERKWHKNSQEHDLGLNALLNTLLIGIFTLANQNISNVRRLHVRHVILKAKRIASDSRLWDFDRNTNQIVQPWELEEMERALVVLQAKL